MHETALTASVSGSCTSATMKRSKRILSILIGIYILMWLLTATWGHYDLYKTFDGDMSDPNSGIQLVHKVKNLKDPSQAEVSVEGYWRYRKCFSMAPFVVRFEYAYIGSSISGGAGKGIALWFFGYKHLLSHESYWEI
jgi:hypothetical protein